MIFLFGMSYCPGCALTFQPSIAAAWLSWLDRRVSDGKVVGAMCKLGITSACSWKSQL